MSVWDDSDFRIEVDPIGFLANNLRGYEPKSILREQLQNADDASHQQHRRGELCLEFLSDRLVASNPSVFSDDDWKRLSRPSSRGKFADAEQTGEFGIGFWGSLHLTDAPIVTSGSKQMTLHPSHPTRREVAHLDGTRVEFPYRRAVTELSTQLDAGIITSEIESDMAATFVTQMAELLLFTRAIDSIRIVLPDGKTRRATRSVEPVVTGVDRLTIAIEGAPEENGRYLVVRSTVEGPPEGRHNRVTAALPLSTRHRGPGRAFFMFPTETQTGVGFNIDAHFRATDDRRSLENTGEHGEWNDRIFQAAGRAVGEALETILQPDVHGLELEDAFAWFASTGSQLADVARRTQIVQSALDEVAIDRKVIPDRKHQFRRGDELVDLPSEISSIIGKAVGESAMPTRNPSTRAVFRRWGLKQWGPTDVARWLRSRLSHERIRRGDAEPFMRDNDSALALLEYCRGQSQLLKGVAVVLGTDDAFHPLAGDLARPSTRLAHLVEGLGRPLVHQSYMGCWVSTHQPETTAEWLRGALVDASELLVGERVPLRNVACAAKQQHVSEAIDVISKTKSGLAGVPLAMDENGRLQRFDGETVVGLSEPGRKSSEALARRLGLCPLHSKIDDEVVSSSGQKFSVQLIVDRIAAVHDWRPTEDSRLLVEVLANIAKEGATPLALVEQLRSRRMWSGNDGITHTLAELRLPERDRLRRPTFPLIDAALLGDVNPSSAVYATFKGLLRVDVLDSAEETVLECEEPSTDPTALRDLLFELVFHRELSKSQKERLRRARFVLCRDGVARQPGEVVLAMEPLPLGLGDRCIDSETGADKRVTELLVELGAQWVPTPDAVIECAKQIADLPVSTDWTEEPGRLLWSFLFDFHERYEPAAMSALADIPWLVATSGERRRPRHCIDPRLNFASLLFPVPAGEQRDRPAPSPPQAFRESLRIRPTLDTKECVELGRRAAEQGFALGRPYFAYLNDRCRRGPADSTAIGALRSLPIIPVGAGGTFVAPDQLVSRQRSLIWQHLRSVVPDDFVAQYSDLLEAWRLTTDGEITWQDQLEVLTELLQEDTNDRRNADVAVARLRDLGQFDLDDHQLNVVCSRGAVPTSKGLNPLAASFRNDLPPDIAERLARHLPIVQESSDIVDLLDRLPLKRLSAVVHLDPIFDGEQLDRVWQPRLAIHAPNVMRFLKDAGTRLDSNMMESWPPQVVSVRSLTIRASMNDDPLDEWPASAHLATVDGEPPILYVKGRLDDPHSIVDAISVAYGIDRGRKSTLLRVLEFGTAAEGERHLDWDGTPALTALEVSMLRVRDALDIHLADDAAVVQTEVSNGDAGPSARVDHPQLVPNPARTKETSDQDSADTEPDQAIDDRLGGDLSDDGDDDDSIVSLDRPVYTEETFRRDLDRPSSPRGTTDHDALEDAGITIVRDLEQETPLEDYSPPGSDSGDRPIGDEHRSVLSFIDVSKGLVAVPGGRLRRLTTEAPLREVLLLGEVVAASQFDDTRIEIANGAEIFHERRIVPGTVVRLHPSEAGRIEIEIRPDLHWVDDVWMLELEDDGTFSRIVQSGIELLWETDDAFYRAERRLEDIEALMADVGKSAVQLVVEVFLARPGEGLTSEQVWGLVAISRLFAVATIEQILRTQTGLFKKVNGLWYKIGDELRVARSRGTGKGLASGGVGQTRSPAATEALALARKLMMLLQSVDDATLRQVANLLSLPSSLADADFADACRAFVKSGDQLQLSAIRREIVADPQLAILAVEELEEVDLSVLRARSGLLEVVKECGTAAAVARGSDLASRLTLVGGIDSADPILSAQVTLRALAEGDATMAQLTDSIVRMWEHSVGDPLDHPEAWLNALLDMEQCHREASDQVSDIGRVGKTRRLRLGQLNQQMPAEVYDTPERQRLRVVVDQLRGASSSTVLDGLHALALVADKTPGSEGDAALLYALVCAEADRTKSKWASIVTRSEKRIAQIDRSPVTDETARFAAAWMAMVRISRSELDRHLRQD